MLAATLLSLEAQSNNKFRRWVPAVGIFPIPVCEVSTTQGCRWTGAPAQARRKASAPGGTALPHGKGRLDPRCSRTPREFPAGEQGYHAYVSINAEIGGGEPGTLWTFLSQVLSPDHSCRDAVGRLLAWRLSQGKSPCSTETMSYCEARQRLPGALMKMLTRDIGGEVHQRAEAVWLWKNKHPVKIADGSTVSMPDTAANQAAYPQSSGQKKGVGFPMARMVVILSLAVGTALDLALGPIRSKKTGENTLFRSLEGALEKGDVLPGTSPDVADQMPETVVTYRCPRQPSQSCEQRHALRLDCHSRCGSARSG
jgi:hypothetical protein